MASTKTDVEMKVTTKPAEAAAAATNPEVVANAAAAADDKKKALPPGDTRTMYEMAHHLLMGSKINILLIAVPLCFPQVTGDGAINFIFSFIALVPLAAMLSDLTEDIALRSNETTAALINVTMGNATELIVSIAALLQGQLDIIKYSLIGSVLGNSLLVLGTALLIGGLKQKLMRFNAVAAKTYGTATVLCIFAYAIASTLASAEPIDDSKVDKDRATLNVSRWCSLVLVLIYCSYVYFSQRSHKHLFEGGASLEEDLENEGESDNKKKDAEKKDETPSAEAESEAPAAESSPSDKKEEGGADAAEGEDDKKKDNDDDDDDDDEEPQYSLTFGLVATAVVTVFIAFASDFLVASIQPATEALHLTRLFVGVVIVPVAANCAEHGTAIIVAAHGKMDLAVGVAAGSSVQIAMFVLPLMVLIGFFADVPLDLTLEPFLLVTMILASILVFFITSSGTATWLGGAKLLCAFFILSVALFNAHDPKTKDTPNIGGDGDGKVTTTTIAPPPNLVR